MIPTLPTRHSSPQRWARFRRTVLAFTVGYAALTFAAIHDTRPEAVRLIPPYSSISHTRQMTLREVVEEMVERFRTRRGGPSVERMLDVAYCESGGRRRARNGDHYGLFQHAGRYWADRSRRAGFAGASIWNVRANVGTAAHMIDRNGGWKHWRACL